MEVDEDRSAADIDVATLRLQAEIAPAEWPVILEDYDDDGVVELMVKFDRQALSAMLSPGERLVAITGQMQDGTPIAGIDAIRVIR